MNRSLSIVTVTLNSERFLPHTIESIASQVYSPTEFILIDGGSSDDTLNIVEQNNSLFSTIVSEPDNGIGDAMNKGIGYCTGDFILFLHSDDYLASNNSLSKAIPLLDYEHDIFAFDIILERNRIHTQCSQDAFTFRINFKTTFFHQAVIFRRSLFSELGGFDTNLSVEMDYDFFLRAYREGAKAKVCREVLSVMRDTGISSKKDWESLSDRFNEEKQIHSKNCRLQSMKAIYWIYWLLYPRYRRLVVFFS